MSSSNIGARQNRNIRDHLFVVNGILNDVHENESKSGVDLGIYDIEKCFDKMWYSETGNNIFKACKRIMYLLDILHKSETELVRKVYISQKTLPVRKII